MFASRVLSVGFLYLLFSAGIASGHHMGHSNHGNPNQGNSQDSCSSVSVTTVTVTVSSSLSSSSAIHVSSTAIPPATTTQVNNGGGNNNQGSGKQGSSGNNNTGGGTKSNPSGGNNNNSSGNQGASGNNNNGSGNNNSSGNGTGNNNNGASGNQGAAGNNNSGGGGGSGNNPQTSFTLDPSVIAPAFAQANGNAANQVPSLVSTNNFINFCVGKVITNGLQNKNGSCNPAPMGNLPSNTLVPSSKFQFPTNNAVLSENQTFTIKMAINNLATGSFTDAATTFFAAPQQLTAQGLIQGHSHVVVEAIDSISSTKLTNPTKFAFFLGLNSVAVDGVLTANVTNGLPAGFYRLASINTAANHQPVLGPVAQHGSFDDFVYFTVSPAGTSNTKTTPQPSSTSGGNNNNNNNNSHSGGGKSGNGKGNKTRRLSRRSRLTREEY